jgi:putative transposase
MARIIVEARGIAVGTACKIFCISETCYRYKNKLSSENIAIADWLIRLAHNEKNWDLVFVFYTYATSRVLVGTINVFTEYTRS